MSRSASPFRELAVGNFGGNVKCLPTTHFTELEISAVEQQTELDPSNIWLESDSESPQLSSSPEFTSARLPTRAGNIVSVKDLEPRQESAETWVAHADTQTRLQELERLVFSLQRKNSELERRLQTLEAPGNPQHSHYADKENRPLDIVAASKSSSRRKGYKPRLAISNLVSQESTSGRLNIPSPIKYRIYIGEPAFTHFYVVKMDESVITEELIGSLIKHMKIQGTLGAAEFKLCYCVTEFSDELEFGKGSRPAKMLSSMVSERESMDWPRMYLRRSQTAKRAKVC